MLVIVIGTQGQKRTISEEENTHRGYLHVHALSLLQLLDQPQIPSILLVLRGMKTSAVDPAGMASTYLRLYIRSVAKTWGW